MARSFESNVLASNILVVDELTQANINRLANLVAEGSSVFRRYQEAVSQSCDAAISYHALAAADLPRHRTELLAQGFFMPQLPSRESLWLGNYTVAAAGLHPKSRRQHTLFFAEPSAVAGRSEAVKEDRRSRDASTDADGLRAMLRRAASLPRRLITFYTASVSVSTIAIAWLVTQFFTPNPGLTASEALFALAGVTIIWFEVLLGFLADARDLRG